MVPEGFVNYFLASAGASAALIGLLFVAISVAPERIIGDEAPAELRAVAGSAFFALLNAFFVSLVALIPKTNIGDPALIMAVVALTNTIGLGRHVWHERRTGREPGAHRLTLLVGSVALYLVEIALAIAVIGTPQHTGYVYGIAYLLLGTYGVGVSRAWELLGARQEGLFALLGLRTDQHSDGQDDAPREPAPPPESVSHT
jgi:hypothetical protein